MSPTEDVKERLDIVELIGASVPLRKVGRTFVGFCPFHPNTRTPAFTVYPDNQSYHCFGCKASGDVFTFVMQRQGLEFRDALEQLAQRAGVQLEPRSPAEAQQDQRRTRLLEINAAAAKYFNYVLLSHRGGQPGRDYVGKRGINDATIEAFQLGFSLPEWSHLLSYLTDKKGFEIEEVEAAGLAIRREHGGYYDRFRGRVIFPIRNAKGETVAFGGRALGDEQPKYLNSPQTALFDKSSVLYGLDLARSEIRARDAVVIVEGYVDVLTAHQYGFRNVVAPLGTALTEGHVALLKKLSRNIFLALDADAAGQKATLRGLSTLTANLDGRDVPVPTPEGTIRWARELEGSVRVIALPDGLDPDEVIRADGGERWRQLVDDARPVMDFYLSALTIDLDLESARGKADAVTRLAPLISQIASPVEQTHYIQQLARLVDTPEGTVRAAIAQETRAASAKAKDERRRANEATFRPPARPSPLALSPSPAAFSREDTLLALLLRHSGALETVRELLERHIGAFPLVRALLPPEPATLLERTENRLIWRAWTTQAAPSADPAAFVADLDEALRDHGARLLALGLPKSQEYRYKQDVEQCALKIREAQARRQIERLNQQIAALPYDDEQQQALRQVIELTAYVSELTTPPRSPSFKDTRNLRE
jgi:DNA primase